MSSTFSITFINERTVDGKYSVFTAPPVVSNSADVYVNSWMSFPTPPSGTFQVDVTMDFFAWIGTTPSKPAPGVVVRTGQTAPVQLGKTSIPMLVKDGYSSFDLHNITTENIPGSFGITTGEDFTVPNTKYMIGLAQKNMNGIIAPTASILANNNTRTLITPVIKFYIGEFNFKAGTVVDYSQSSAKSADIDFSTGEGAGYSSAVVRHLSTGKFDVKYVSSSKK